ncbi:hypothetical protein VIGAN_04435300 [Vigna angularis var. angularis]|uniref:Uncharacterized protein n=1 Tax=Vigna angularis var. angularis TaxID=157739 RepID=A0A0S3S1K2_PHAAN|nr:hypothetical protein VIGAN_04435300 [Vigna angularis var. angularis]
MMKKKVVVSFKLSSKRSHIVEGKKENKTKPNKKPQKHIGQRKQYKETPQLPQNPQEIPFTKDGQQEGELVFNFVLLQF